MDKKELIKSYLSDGVPPEAVARAVGVDPSYVSQLMNDEEFDAEVVGARATKIAADNKVDDKIKRGEESALDRILQKLPTANLQQSLQVFRVLNGAKLRRDGMLPAQSQLAVSQVVEIYLPGALVPQYVKNKQAEIIEVNGETMVSAGVKQLERLADQRLAELRARELPPNPGMLALEQKEQQGAEMLETMTTEAGEVGHQRPKRPQRLDLKNLLEQI